MEIAEPFGRRGELSLPLLCAEYASTSEPLRLATADVFESWIGRTAGYMAEAGIPEERAGELAISTLAILEGAFLLSRAGRDTAPMAIAGAAAGAAVRAALPGA